jgi:hypothetical protein
MNPAAPVTRILLMAVVYTGKSRITKPIHATDRRKT